MLGTLTRESLVLVNENTSHPPPLHVRGTRVRFYGKRKRRRGCNERVEEEEEIKEEEEEKRRKKEKERKKRERRERWKSDYRARAPGCPRRVRPPLRPSSRKILPSFTFPGTPPRAVWRDLKRGET